MNNPTKDSTKPEVLASSEEGLLSTPVAIETENENADNNQLVTKTPKSCLLDHSPGEYRFVVALGMLMAFIAGYSNAVCLSGNIHAINNSNTLQEQVNMSVAGVTGAYTNSAIGLGKLDWDIYRRNVFTILSVCAGACLSSLFNPYPVAFCLCPRYGLAFMVGGLFTTFGAISSLHQDNREFYFTAFGNGVMNGISSMYTSNLIRTTHLTGTTTDIGLFVGQYLCGNHSNLWKLTILVGLACSFWTGSIVGYFLSLYEREQSLIMNAGFFYVFGVSTIGYNKYSHPSWTWRDAVWGVDYCGPPPLPSSGAVVAKENDNPKGATASNASDTANKNGRGDKTTRDCDIQEVEEQDGSRISAKNNTPEGNNEQQDDDDQTISMDDVIHLFRQLDDNTGSVDPQELAILLLEQMYTQRQQRQQHVEALSKRDIVRSCARKSINRLRISGIREIESSSGRHVTLW